MNHLHDYIAHVIIETECDICRIRFDDIVAIPQLSQHYDELRSEAASRGYKLKFMFDEPRAVDALTLCVLEEPCAFYRVEVSPV